MKEAERLSMIHGQDGTVVISGEGVRGYYYKLGYEPTKHFLIKKFGTFERGIVKIRENIDSVYFQMLAVL